MPWSRSVMLVLPRRVDTCSFCVPPLTFSPRTFCAATLSILSNSTTLYVPISIKAVPSPDAAPIELVVEAQNELTFFDPLKPLLAGATVTVYSDTGASMGSATTDADGRAAFPGLPEGLYRVTASAPDHASATKVRPALYPSRNNLAKSCLFGRRSRV